MRRLHHRIYLSLLLVALLSVIGAGLASHVLPDRRFESPYAARLLADAEYIARALQAEAQPQPALGVLAKGLRLHAAVLDGEGGIVAASVHPPPRVRGGRLPTAGQGPRWIGTSRGPALAVSLGGGRTLAVWSRVRHGSVLVVLAVFFALLAVGSIPVARGLTRRLAALEHGFTELGAGRLSTRVAVQGGDEIARLAERFNASAERIERLVDAQRRALQGASHELRSPLARIRMALELIAESGGPDVAPRVAGATQDVAELDALVDDLLLASRIETEPELTGAEALDLADLAAEEGQRAGARLELLPAPTVGDPRLLRRLVRNLIDNALRHGAGTEVTVGTAAVAGGVRLWVADRGPGVPAEDRERIFAPFHRGSRASDDSSGVGLGLSLVWQIAERHGGSVSCREREGGGALFEVTLPARTPSA